MANDDKTSRWIVSGVWIARIVVGITFIVSGWSKSIDPWGFIYKIEEYVNVWGFSVPREFVISVAVLISLVEFALGVMIVTGSMRRAAVWLSGLFMCVMLPLTVYIAIADPVSDCGCFGDFIILSNTATLVKNIVLSVLIGFLIYANGKVSGIYNVSLQWLVAFGAVVYPLCLVYIGYRFQPVVDFRPYPVGFNLAEAIDDDSGRSDSAYTYIYMKDGRECEFSLDSLPDSTWTFVSAKATGEVPDAGYIAIYDGDDEVTDDVIKESGSQLILVVTDPGIHYLTRVRLVNELSRYMKGQGGEMIALVAAEDERLELWKQLARPDFPVYSAEDTSLKELVRGDAALVGLVDGRIMWKRNLVSVSHDVIARSGDNFDKEMSVDGTKVHLWLSSAFVLWLVIIYILNFPDKYISRYFSRRMIKK